MPFPVALAAAGLGLGASLFGPKQKEPKVPQYFYNNPQELLPLIRQSVQSGYGGAGEMLREELSNAGLFQSGGYSTEFGKLAQARGQEESRAQTNFLTHSYDLERGAALDFQGKQYFDTLGYNRQLQDNFQQAIGGFGGAVGGYFADQEARKRQDDIIEAIIGKRPGKK